MLVALAVVAISLPIGTAAAILINSLRARARSVLYGVMVAPILTPGAVIGISTLLFWNKFSVPAGPAPVGARPGLLHRRLRHASGAGPAAELRSGRSRKRRSTSAPANVQVMRRILLPHLYPAIGAGAVIAFFQSIENFNITLFTRGTYDTLTVYVVLQVRTGITPTINALALILIVLPSWARSGTRFPAAAPSAGPAGEREGEAHGADRSAHRVRSPPSFRP